MSVFGINIALLDGRVSTVGEIVGHRPSLVVNVASLCGLTPQYAALQEMHAQYAERGFTVLGVPCNQFGEQEPGSHEEIQAFCSTSYRVTFPLTEKVRVNGPARHPLYAELVTTPDPEGRSGDIAWNFEKFLLDGDGNPIARFGPRVLPDDPVIAAALEGVFNHASQVNAAKKNSPE